MPIAAGVVQKMGEFKGKPLALEVYQNEGL